MADTTQFKQDDDLDMLVSEATAPPAPVKKVELDLDDAPFLQADEKAPPALPTDEDLNIESAEDAAAKAKRRKRKLLIFGAAGVVLLLVAAAAAWWFFLREPPVAGPEPLKPEVIVVPSTPVQTQKPDIVREFAPFVVPVRDGQGQDHFLIFKFSAITTDANIGQEVQQQLLPLRDAIYYYLRSKDSAFLQDARNGDQIKKDLLSVFNDYLTQGKLEDILFESYLHK